MVIDGKERGLVGGARPRIAEVEPPEAPREGDIRIVEETKPWPHRFRVDWYGTMTPRVGLGPMHRPRDPVTGWRVAESYGVDGYFPTREAAVEALAGPKVVAYFRQGETA